MHQLCAVPDPLLPRAVWSSRGFDPTRQFSCFLDLTTRLWSWNDRWIAAFADCRVLVKQVGHECLAREVLPNTSFEVCCYLIELPWQQQRTMIPNDLLQKLHGLVAGLLLG